MMTAVRFIEGELRERVRSGYDTTLPRLDVMAALLSAPDGKARG